MFRTSYVHRQEDYIVHVALYGIFFMRLCKQSTRRTCSMCIILVNIAYITGKLIHIIFFVLSIELHVSACGPNLGHSYRHNIKGKAGLL